VIETYSCIRAVTAVLTVLTMATRLYYLLRAARVDAGGMVIGQADNPVSVWIILYSAASIVSIMAFVIHPNLMYWSLVSLPYWSRWAGAGLGSLGLILLLWSHSSLGRNFFAGLQVRKHHQLIINGPYRWIRHPMYLAFIALGLGFSLLTASWFVGGTWFAGLSLMLITRLVREEEMLVGQFGESYAAYRKRTGGFMPRPWRKP
jgi:protein-S-isoprenylcysteine O-methyltransferase Ste14